VHASFCTSRHDRRIIRYSLDKAGEQAQAKLERTIGSDQICDSRGFGLHQP
jgi:hypothetical protein